MTDDQAGRFTRAIEELHNLADHLELESHRERPVARIVDAIREHGAAEIDALGDLAHLIRAETLR